MSLGEGGLVVGRVSPEVAVVLIQGIPLEEAQMVVGVAVEVGLDRSCQLTLKPQMNNHEIESTSPLDLGMLDFSWHTCACESLA
jgi:hypothetical protein